MLLPLLSQRMQAPLITFSFLLLAISKVFATAQFPDKILYQGEKYNLNSNPLESYFEKYPDKRPKGGVQSTALWRGYVATFEVKDSQLFLKDIAVEIWDDSAGQSSKTKWKSVMNEVFASQEVVKIDWFTGLLVIPYGKLINYVHMGYGSAFENYYLLEFEKGDFKRSKQFDHKNYDRFKEKQFQVFKKTEENRALVEKLAKDGSSPAFIDSFLKDFLTNYTSKILTD